MHVTLASQRVVHGEGSGEAVTGVSARGQFEVFAEQWLVVGVSTVLDDELCTLCGALATQVGDALLGDDDVDIVL